MSRDASIAVYVDADACPVKDETYKVAERHGLRVFVVANAFIAVPRASFIERVAVPAGPDEADNWIPERAPRRGLLAPRSAGLGEDDPLILALVAGKRLPRAVSDEPQTVGAGVEQVQRRRLGVVLFQ